MDPLSDNFHIIQRQFFSSITARRVRVDNLRMYVNRNDKRRHVMPSELITRPCCFECRLSDSLDSRLIATRQSIARVDKWRIEKSFLLLNRICGTSVKLMSASNNTSSVIACCVASQRDMMIEDRHYGRLIWENILC